MANIRQLASGHWQVQIRLKGRKATETFIRHDHARVWATEAEAQIDRGRAPSGKRSRNAKTFGALIDLHIDDMKEVGRPLRRSKSATLEMLQRELGALKFGDLDRERLIRFGRERAKGGAGPVTLGQYIGAINLVFAHAAAVHGVEVSVEPVEYARIALKRLGLVGKGRERDRRPTEDELKQLFTHFDSNARQLIPMSRIIKFAIATAMRQEEICRVTWSDLNVRTRMLTIRDRKDPRAKMGNDQRIPLLAVSGYNALTLIEDQRAIRSNANDRIFPYVSKSASASFTRACAELEIEDLHFHDLRHEGTSRLFEAGFSIQQVALVTGHKDWKMLRRYTHLKPETLHLAASSRAA
ncbi:MAG: site-specific integrase [Alphaproteobacteria bacterium]|nr:site-specific integrase [Alphaproteobacteria bacterium]MDE2112438.1 site-specific integrase [Alphaproteobacteria bacterium]MDE2494059.1 site-specific integrase [Alphaproteobacteria bacterium]